MLTRFDRRLVALRSGPGFGKTTLLGQAMAENALAPRGVDVSLTCGPHHRVGFTLASDLLAALGLEGPAPSDTAETVATIGELISSRSPVDVALLLDDVQILSTDTPAAELVRRLLNELPGNGHLVLSGRDLPVDTARLEAEGRARLVGEGDLAFTPDELAEFARLRDVGVDVLADSAGWPAIAELTARAGASRAADFLWEELLKHLSPEQRRTLATLCVLGGTADRELLVAALETNGDPDRDLIDLPLVFRSSNGSWTVHTLWATQLGSALAFDDAQRARVAAARVQSSRGRVAEAMQLLLDARAWDEVRDLIRTVCADPPSFAVTDLMLDWYKQLPAAMQRDPDGMMLRGIAFKVDDPAAGAELLTAAADAFRTQSADDCELTCLVALAHLYFLENDIVNMYSVVGRVDDLALRLPRAAALRRLAQALVAPTPAVGLDELDQVSLIDLGPMALGVEKLRVAYLTATGLPERAEQVLRRVGAHSSPDTVAALIEILRSTRRVDEAMAQSDRALTDRTLSPRLTPDHAVHIVLKAFTGRLDEARALLPNARVSITLAPAPWSRATLALAEAAIAVAAGDEKLAGEALQPEVDGTPGRLSQLLTYHTAWLPLTYVLCSSTRGDWESETLAGTLLTIREQVAALVAIRERGSLVGVRRLDDTGLENMAGQLPRPWIAELGLALHALGRPSGRQVLEALGMDVHTLVRALARHSVPPIAQAARGIRATLPAMPQGPLEVRVLGTLQVITNGRASTAPELRRDRVRQLLSFLLIHPTTLRDTAAAALWPDLDVASAGRNLRVTLAYLQRVFEPDRDQDDPPYHLRSVGTSLRLTRDMMSVDAWAFDEVVDQAVRADNDGVPSQAIIGYQAALQLYRGELLADVPSVPWLDAERDRLRTRYVHAATRTGELMLAAGEPHRALRLAAQALRADQWYEPAHRLAVVAHHVTGDHAGARRALRACQEALDELGVEPQPETLMIARRVTPQSWRERPGPEPLSLT